MKLICCQSFSRLIEFESKNHRRCDFIDPITFQLPESLQDGELDDIVMVSQYNGTETLELINAIVTMDDPDIISFDTNVYQIISTAGKRKRRLFQYIKAVRNLSTNPAPAES
jgi:hypothetical protein